MLKKGFAKWIVIVLLILGSSNVAIAQNVTKSTVEADNIDGFADVFDFTVWLESAIALSPFDYGFYAKGTLQRSGRISSIRGMVLGNAVSDNIYRENHFEEVGVMYGWASSPGRIHYSVSAGISAIRVAGSEQNEPEFTTGFPVDLALSYRPLPLIGFGVSAFANFNEVHNVGGLALRLDVGLLR